MANKDRGEIALRIGGQTRTLRFRTAEMMLLEDRLGMDPIGWLGAQKGSTKFLVEAIFCGLSKTEKKLTPLRVATWLDDDEPIAIDGREVNREELVKEILYSIARGKPREEAVEMVRILDEAFGRGGEAEDGSSPLDLD
jgi:hypothetical protein